MAPHLQLQGRYNMNIHANSFPCSQSLPHPHHTLSSFKPQCRCQCSLQDFPSNSLKNGRSATHTSPDDNPPTLLQLSVCLALQELDTSFTGTVFHQVVSVTFVPWAPSVISRSYALSKFKKQPTCPSSMHIFLHPEIVYLFGWFDIMNHAYFRRSS